MLNKIGLGTVQFGLDYGISNKSGITNFYEVERILQFAFESGILLLDTAFAYGKSEEVLGKVGVRQFKVISKTLPESCGLTTNEQLNQSLRYLKSDHLYGLLLHRPGDLLENPLIWDTYQGFKNKRVVDKIGFSFNSLTEAETVLGKGFHPDIIQVPFSYLDNRFQKVMIDLREKGCEIHARSCFLQGLFFIKASEINSFFSEITPVITELQSRFGNILPGVLLKYCLSKPFIDSVIIGINSYTQLKNNLELISINEELGESNFSFNEEILMPSNWPKNER